MNCTVIDLSNESPVKITRIVNKNTNNNNNKPRQKAAAVRPSPRKTPNKQVISRFAVAKRKQIKKKRRVKNRRQPPPGGKAPPPKKAATKRKFTTTCQPLTLKPPYPYKAEDDDLTVTKSTLAALSDLWLPVADPCSIFKEELKLNPSNVTLVIFVDLDNVGCKWIKANRNIPSNILVWGFCGQGHNINIKLNQFRNNNRFKDNRLFITVCGGGSNSADFGLTYYAGELNHILPKEIPFAIASNDNDLRHLHGHLKMGRSRAIIVNLQAFNCATYKNLHFLLFRCKHLLEKEFPGEGWDKIEDGREEAKKGDVQSGMYDILREMDDTEIYSLIFEAEEAEATRRRSRNKKEIPCAEATASTEGEKEKGNESEKEKETIVIDLDALPDPLPPSSTTQSPKPQSRTTPTRISLMRTPGRNKKQQILRRAMKKRRSSSGVAKSRKARRCNSNTQASSGPPIVIDLTDD